MNKIPVIYYHSVAPKKNIGWYKNYLTLELRYFEDMLRYLTAQNYQFLFVEEYMEKREGAHEKQKMVCLNFDDGCLDNYVYAYPLLLKYNAKATIFVNPEFVPKETNIRRTLKDVWDGNCKLEELEELGFCNWREMALMEHSGAVDIQSHTLTHTKHYFNDVIKDFHHPKANYLYPIANRFSILKPYYITDPSFIQSIPFGTPFFEEKSAVLVKRIWINPDFEEACVNALKSYDWKQYDKKECLEKIAHLYASFKQSNTLIIKEETHEEYENRVWLELSESKRIIGEQLQKEVKYCCWPHGDHNDFAHETALKAGYKATTIVLEHGQINTDATRFDRIGHANVKNSRMLTLLKMRYKLSLYTGNVLFSWIDRWYFKWKYGK